MVTVAPTIYRHCAVQRRRPCLRSGASGLQNTSRRGLPTMRSALFAAENMEKESQQPGMRLQNSKLLKIEMNGEIMARTGSMVAYQGQMQFQALGSGGMGKWLKQKLTGEGVPLMKISGRGDLFLADRAADVHLIDLEQGDGISINGANVLAFEPTLQYDIKFVQGMGMLS